MNSEKRNGSKLARLCQLPMEPKLDFWLGFPAAPLVFTPVPEVPSLLARLTAALGEAGDLSVPSTVLSSAGSGRRTERRRQGEKQGEQEKGEGEEEKYVLTVLSQSVVTVVVALW